MDLKVIKNTEEMVLIEVIFEDMLDKMSNSGFTGKEKFIKVTKGENHTITLYDVNNDSYCSFNFGKSGYTLISDSLSIIKNKILVFLLSEHIQIEKMTEKVETELTIMPITNGLGITGRYCIHLGGKPATFLQTKEEIEDIFGEYEIYDKSIAVTGVTVYKATLKPLVRN